MLKVARLVLLLFTVVATGGLACASDTEEQTMFRLAKTFLDEGKIEEAKIVFERALAAYPNNSLGQYYFAEALARSETNPADIERAQRLYTKVYEAHPREEIGLLALVEAKKLEKKVQAAKAEAESQRAIIERRQREAEAAEREKQRAAKEAEMRAAMSRRAQILENLGDAEKYYIVVRRNLTPAEAAEPGRKEETAYCVWFEETGYMDDPETGTTLKDLKLFARAANAGQRTVSWLASSSWNEDQTILRIRPTDPAKRLGIDIFRSNGRVVPRPANWPFPIAYALRDINAPCAFKVK